MLHLHRSHRLEDLAEALAFVLAQPTDDPFRPDWVVAHGRATEQWLRARIAQRLGVCAHVRFLTPSALLEEVIERTLGVTRATARAWRGEHLTWAVLGAFGDERFTADPAAAPLLGYLATDGTGSARALQLARTVAEQFQRYVVWRPTLVRGWETSESDASDWQPALWRAVRHRLGNAEPSMALLERARGAVETNGLPDGMPARVAWLGRGAVGSLHLDAAALLASAGVPVHLLLPTPARALAVPGARPAHPLLRSLGRAAAGMEAAVAALGRRHGPPRVADVAHVAVSSTAPGERVLDRIQRDIVGDASPGLRGAPRPAIAEDDGSLRVHVCHGRARQADALRDELLALFAASPDLMPRDVLVLAPDVAGFAPLVSAAFAGTPEAGRDAVPSIPLRVADRPLRVENPVMDAALRLLALAEGRLDAVALLDFIGLPAVRARFEIAAEEQAVLRQWTRESGIRWGMDGRHREAFDVPGDREHTWRFGLDRMLLGWAWPGASLFGASAERALPYAEIEGKDAELLGRLAEAVECTRRAVDALLPLHRAPGDAREHRAVGAWCDVLASTLGSLVDARSTAASRLGLDAVLRAVRESAADARVAIDLAAFRTLLEARFAEPADAPDDGAGAVTLAALAVGRVRPARVICLLGMDDGAFPRPRGAAGFDALARSPEAGDPDANAEDRQCVLDAVLAARDRLVITYAGRRCDTNERVAPAVPVSELLDVVDATFAAYAAFAGDDASVPARTMIEVEHPLQPFSPRNFGTRPLSHDPVHLAGARALLMQEKRTPGFLTRSIPDAPGDGGARVVPLDVLARFFANPAQALLVDRLRVRDRREEEMETREPSLVDHLALYHVRDALLQETLGAGASADDAFDRFRARGLLPHGALGRLAFDAARAEATRVADAAAPSLGGALTTPLDVDVRIGAWRVVGRVPRRRADGGLLEVQASVPRPKRIVSFWVRHLALQAMLGAPAASTLVGLPHRTDCPGGVCGLAGVNDPEAALGTLLELYERGSRAPLPFFPETSRAYVRALNGDETAHARAVAEARKTFRASYNRTATEATDASVRRLFADAIATLDDPLFAPTARAVWEPLRAHLTTEST